ncbi:MAG: aminotransferase class V-fold PLP-dependent enzyme [Anaerolineales bacterium]
MLKTIYDELGLRPVINAAGTLTRLGGALMPPEVVEAMARAAEHCVRMEELQARAGEIIAEASGAEAGYVTCGAAAGLLLGAAACVAGLDIHKMERLPDTNGMRDEVIIQRPHRNSYDHAIRTVGVKIVEVGWMGSPTPRPVQPWEIESAINPHTAAIYWPVMEEAEGKTVRLAETVAVAHRHGVPVIVDASAALPPTGNLRAFIAAGADLVAYSGGKSLRGPQATGLLAGRRDLIQSVALQHQDMDVHPTTWSLRAQLLDTGILPGPPLQGIGRSLKVGKEEIVGLLTALRLFLARDEVAEHARWLAQSRTIAEALSDMPGLQCDIVENAQGIPLAHVQWEEARLRWRGAELVNALAEGDPPIGVGGDGAGGVIVLNPFSLASGEAAMVAQRLRELLASTRRFSEDD